MLGPTLEMDRLILRPPIAEHLDGWEAFGADPDTMRFMGGVQPRAAVWRAHAMMAGSWALHGYVEKSTGLWVGRLGPWRPEGWPGTEVGWGLLRSAWGRGYASEGATAVMHWVVDRLGWTDIIHVIAPDNAASQSVARRLGAANRGPGLLPDPLQDSVVELWGQTAAEWKVRRSST